MNYTRGLSRTAALMALAALSGMEAGTAQGAPLNERRPLGASVDDPLAGLASVAAAQGRSPEVDPYSPDPALYSPEWMAEFDRRCAEAVAEMTAAIERARQGR